MYLCYIDESGDVGQYLENSKNSGTRYFILAAIFIRIEKWKYTLENFKIFRKKKAKEGLLPYDIEFHCSELIDPHKIKAYTQIGTAERWQLIKEFAEIINLKIPCHIISVINDKFNSYLTGNDLITKSVTNLYIAIDEFLATQKSHGMVIFDRANEKQLNTHIRSLLGTGGYPVDHIRIKNIVEDPFFKKSEDSFFIQAADVVAFTVKEKEFPMASRKKFNADKIFDNLLSAKLFKSKISEDDGLIRI